MSGRKKILNPITGRMVYADGAVGRKLKGSKEREVRPYRGLRTKDFCQPENRKFPVTTEKKCRAALSYARYAKNPDAVRECAIKRAKKYGWRCGVSYTK